MAQAIPPGIKGSWLSMRKCRNVFLPVLSLLFAREEERRLDGTWLIPPSIERILNVHAQMPQQFAYLSFPDSLQVRREKAA